MISRDDRGVSELVGFTLSFGIIMASIALLYGVGYPGLLEYQEHEQLNNAERSFNAMAENFDDVARYAGIDTRSSEIALQQGTIATVGSSTEMTIDTGSFLQSISLGRLTYENAERTIAYEGGGVFAGDAEGTVLVREPRMTCSDEKAVITLIQDNSPSDSLLSSDPVMVTMEQQSNVTYLDSNEHVEIDMSYTDGPDGGPDFQGGWESALEETGFEEESPNTWVCDSPSPDAVIIRITTVEISF